MLVKKYVYDIRITKSSEMFSSGFIFPLDSRANQEWQQQQEKPKYAMDGFIVKVLWKPISESWPCCTQTGGLLWNYEDQFVIQTTCTTGI